MKSQCVNIRHTRDASAMPLIDAFALSLLVSARDSVITGLMLMRRPSTNNMIYMKRLWDIQMCCQMRIIHSRFPREEMQVV